MALIFSIIILSLLFGALSILFIPFHISAHIKKSGPKVHAYLDITWFLKIFRLRFTAIRQKFSIYIFGRKIATTSISHENKKRKQATQKHKSISPSKDLMIPAIELFIRIIKTFSLDKIYLKMDIGSNNPASTGIIMGYIHALKGSFFNIPHRSKNIELKIRPHFNKEIYDLKGIIRIKNQMINLLSPSFQFITSRPVLRHIKKYISRI